MNFIGFLIFLTVYVVHGFMLLPFDMWTVAHEAAKPIKIQPDAKIASKLQVGKLARSVGVNILVTFLYTQVAAAQVIWSRGSQGFRVEQNLPSKSEQLVCFLVGLAWNEFTFYYSHRLMHQPRWYRKFHKQHHEYTAPFALAAIYCTPVEMLVCNLFTFLSIASLWRFNLFFYYCWVANAVMGTQTHHSGYKWPWMTSFDHQPNVHDLHHQCFNCNFGNVGLLDFLHGTARDPYAFQAQQKSK
jgi:sterol desaturase/sphingolipid hydroxylase (fatty acid hydroxylase superfamily)